MSTEASEADLEGTDFGKESGFDNRNGQGIRDLALSHMPEALRGIAANGYKALEKYSPYMSPMAAPAAAIPAFAGMVKGLGESGWQPPNAQGYSPYKPAQPGHMPNDAINPVGSDTQMATAIAATAPFAALKGVPATPQAPLLKEAVKDIAGTPKTIASQAGKESLSDFNARIRDIAQKAGTLRKEDGSLTPASFGARMKQNTFQNPPPVPPEAPPPLPPTAAPAPTPAPAQGMHPGLKAALIGGAPALAGGLHHLGIPVPGHLLGGIFKGLMGE